MPTVTFCHVHIFLKIYLTFQVTKPSLLYEEAYAIYVYLNTMYK